MAIVMVRDDADYNDMRWGGGLIYTLAFSTRIRIRIRSPPPFQSSYVTNTAHSTKLTI